MGGGSDRNEREAGQGFVAVRSISSRRILLVGISGTKMPLNYWAILHRVLLLSVESVRSCLQTAVSPGTERPGGGHLKHRSIHSI